MEEGAKRRLVGAAVLVALLVIFVPMLVDEGEEPPMPESALVVPPRPAVEPPRDPPPMSGLTQDEELAEGTGGAGELAPPPLYIPPQADAEPDLQEDTWTPAPVYIPEPEPKISAERGPEPDRESAPSEPPASAAAPEPPPVRGPARPSDGGAPSAWVVQVAALTEQPRATALERDLRSKGFPAFIETVRVDGRIFHRVRVGPEPDRGRIETMAASLKERGLSAQIQRYP